MEARKRVNCEKQETSGEAVEYAEQPHKGREAKGDRESDRFIVPKKAGNAAGGKESDKWTSAIGRHRPRTGAGNGCEHN